MPSVSPSTTTLPPKPFSISFGSSKPKPVPVTAPKKRPHSALAEPDSDHEDESSKTQLVSAFDQSGAVVSESGSKAQAPLVIQAERNRDWREESRKKRRKNLLPGEVQAAQSSKQDENSHNGHAERDEVSTVSGIQFVNKDQNGDENMREPEATNDSPEQKAQVVKTANEEALEALLSGEKKSTLQIPALSANEPNGSTSSDIDYTDYTNEDDRFRADVASRPNVSTLEDYAAIPVEEFGAALLRGMGWKEGEAIGKRRAGVPAPKEPKVKERRPALLGIGAKETPGGVGDEFGAWGKAAKGGGKRKTELSYNPVVLQNSKTGEMLTEEELQRKKEEQKKAEKDEDWRERRDRNLRIDEERKMEKKERYQKERHQLAIEDKSNYSSSEFKDSRNRARDREGERRRERSRSKERRERDRSRDGERRYRDRDVDSGDSRHSSSRRHSRSRERSKHYSSSRRERSRSSERRHRRY